jgi:hypothetical protein
MAAEFSHLAKDAPSDFVHRYYERLAERYTSLAQDELAIAERQKNSPWRRTGSSSIERSDEAGHQLDDGFAVLVPPEIGRMPLPSGGEKPVKSRVLLISFSGFMVGFGLATALMAAGL